jgi:hypothetical protein
MKWLIIAEDGSGSDFSYSARFYFDDEAPARALAQKLNNAATSTFTLTELPAHRKAPEPKHSERVTAALAVLQALDPAALPTTYYRVQSVAAWVAPNEGAPSSQAEALFRAIRDLS